MKANRIIVFIALCLMIAALTFLPHHTRANTANASTEKSLSQPILAQSHYVKKYSVFPAKYVLVITDLYEFGRNGVKQWFTITYPGEVRQETAAAIAIILFPFFGLFMASYLEPNTRHSWLRSFAFYGLFLILTYVLMLYSGLYWGSNGYYPMASSLIFTLLCVVFNPAENNIAKILSGLVIGLSVSLTVWYQYGDISNSPSFLTMYLILCLYSFLLAKILWILRASFRPVRTT